MKPMQPSSDLASVVGSSPMPRTEVTKKLWQYIKRKGLQDSKNRRMINADENLRPIFGRGQVSMFEMTRLVNKHLRNPYAPLATPSNAGRAKRAPPVSQQSRIKTAWDNFKSIVGALAIFLLLRAFL